MINDLMVIPITVNEYRAQIYFIKNDNLESVLSSITQNINDLKNSVENILPRNIVESIETITEIRTIEIYDTDNTLLLVSNSLPLE